MQQPKPQPQQVQPQQQPRSVVSTAPPAQKATASPAPAASASASSSDYVYDNTATNDKNPLVYFNFTVGGEPAGKVCSCFRLIVIVIIISLIQVIVELFADRVPKTVHQFRKLCEKGYGGTTMTRFVPDYLLQGGEVGAPSPFASGFFFVCL